MSSIRSHDSLSSILIPYNHQKVISRVLVRGLKGALGLYRVIWMDWVRVKRDIATAIGNFRTRVGLI